MLVADVANSSLFVSGENRKDGFAERSRPDCAEMDDSDYNSDGGDDERKRPNQIV